MFLEDVDVVVIQHPFLLFLGHLEILMLQLQQNRLVRLNHRLQSPYFKHQPAELNLAHLPLAFRALQDSRARHEDYLRVSLVRIAGIVMLDMPFLAGALGVPKLGDFGRFVIEARVDLAEFVGIWVVEVGEGVGVA